MRFRAFVLILSCVSFGCGQPDQAASNTAKATEHQPRIVVTSQPLLEMTQALVGDAADVVLITPDVSASRDWTPTSAEVRIMQQADLILLSGAGYEPWKDRVSLPGSRVRDTAAGYYDQLIRIPDAVTHQHGPDGSHSHPGTVWATWLDPDLCASQLHQVSSNCQKLLPGRKQVIASAETALSGKLNTLNSVIASVKADADEEELVVFSDTPHYQYLIHRLGWTLQYLHWDTSDTISEKDKSELLDTFALHTGNRGHVFLLDSRRSIETENFVRESGGIVVRIDLCESAASESISLPDRLKKNFGRIREALLK